MLNRVQRIEITAGVLKKLYPQCVRRKNLFPDKDADDLIEDVGVYVWLSLLRYRGKPITAAWKLAYTTGQNRLNSIVRSQLTVVKRGAKAKIESVEDAYWLTGHDIHSNSVRIIDTLESLTSAAITRVGVNRADALLRALLYDWRVDPMPEQLPIMEKLRRDRKNMRRLVTSFIISLRHKMPLPHEPKSIQKVEGKWKEL